MDTHSILTVLRTERDHIIQAISALEALNGGGTASSPKKTGRRKMSAAGRKRISEAAKKRWAAIRPEKAAPATTPSRKARKPMSRATKMKLAAAAKARWAERKKAKA